MKKFWDFFRNDAGERILRLEGPVDEDNFWGDEVTPAQFREELESEEGDVTVWINSPGGNVFAAAQIYTMLCDHKGAITVKIDAIAASAASVIAMAGDRVLMSPVAMIMIHDPMTMAMGNAKDMEKAISTLNEVKASIINAYQLKTGLSKNKISQLMENETWMNAKKAVELGFADEILFAKGTPEPEESKEEKQDGKEIEAAWQPYSTKAMGQRVLNWLLPPSEEPAVADAEPVEAEGDAQGLEQAETGVEDAADEADGEQGTLEEAAEEAGNPVEEAPSDTIPEQKDADAAIPELAAQDASEQPAAMTIEEPPTVEDEKPKAPAIGLDGKTEDGAMPFELLKKQLDFLK